MNYEEIYNSNKQEKLFGRYITLENIEPILNQLNINNQLETIGYSVLEKPIFSYTIGNGKNRMLIWSQMHGNESTTTKAIFDLLNLLHSKTEYAKNLLKNFTYCIIPMLNPDGAKLYTRENANNVDLNRDFKNLSQPESNVLMKVFNIFKPDFCYNTHDQRTIHGIYQSGKPATVSFLAPSFNENCDYNENRCKAAQVIAAMFLGLNNFIPNQIGRFDDAFNENCAGDSFQKLGIPTILFEAGHFQNDYIREITRKYIFISFLISFEFISLNCLKLDNVTEYLNIPQNNTNFYDIICKNVKVVIDNQEKIINFALQYQEVLNNNDISYIAVMAKINNIDNDFGHFVFDAKNEILTNRNQNFPEIDEIVNFSIGENFNIFNGEFII